METYKGTPVKRTWDPRRGTWVYLHPLGGYVLSSDLDHQTCR